MHILLERVSGNQHHTRTHDQLGVPIHRSKSSVDIYKQRYVHEVHLDDTIGKLHTALQLLPASIVFNRESVSE